MLGLFSETTKLSATNAAQLWTPTGAPQVNPNQNNSWQAVYLIVTDGPIHILHVDEANTGAVVSSANGARIPANWPMLFAADIGDQISYIRGDDAAANVNVWITRVANK